MPLNSVVSWVSAIIVNYVHVRVYIRTKAGLELYLLGTAFDWLVRAKFIS